MTDRFDNSIGDDELSLSKLTIETTIGDLIYAISEAAEEARVDDDDIAELTQHILQSLVTRGE